MPKLPKANPESAGPSPLAKVGECLYRHQSSRVYYALVKHAGKQHRKSLKTTDRQIANRKLGEFRRKVTALSRTTAAGKLTFDDVAKKWADVAKAGLKTRSFQRRLDAIKQIRPFIGHLKIRQLSATVLEEWASRRSPATSASTYNKERDTIIAILEYACREGLLLDNPARVLKRRKLQRRALTIPTQEQFSKLVALLRASGKRHQDAADLVELLAYSGMRLAEATSMKWSHVSFDQGRFTVTGGDEGTKNHEAREVPLFPAVRSLLERLRARDKPEASDLVSPIASAKKALETACKNVEIPRFTHHSLRHYFVSNAIEAGVDFKTIAAWVGHKDGGLLVAKTYGHLRDTHSADMAKRMTFAAA